MVSFKHFLSIGIALAMVIALQISTGMAANTKRQPQNAYANFSTNWLPLFNEIESKTAKELNDTEVIKQIKATYPYTNLTPITETDAFGTIIIHLAVKNNHFKFAHYLFNQLPEQLRYQIARSRDYDNETHLPNETLFHTVLTKLHRFTRTHESIYGPQEDPEANDNVSLYSFAKKIAPYSNLDTQAFIPDPMVIGLQKKMYSARDLFYSYEEPYCPSLAKQLQDSNLSDFMGPVPVEIGDNAAVAAVTDQLAALTISPATLTQSTTIDAAATAVMLPRVDITKAINNTPAARVLSPVGEPVQQAPINQAKTDALRNPIQFSKKSALRVDTTPSSDSDDQEEDAVKEDEDDDNTAEATTTVVDTQRTLLPPTNQVISAQARSITTVKQGYAEAVKKNLTSQELVPNTRMATPLKQRPANTKPATKPMNLTPTVETDEDEDHEEIKLLHKTTTKPTRAATPLKERSASKYQTTKPILSTTVEDNEGCSLSSAKKPTKRTTSPTPFTNSPTSIGSPSVVSPAIANEQVSPLEQFIAAVKAKNQKQVKTILKNNGAALIKGASATLLQALQAGTDCFVALIKGLPYFEKNLNNAELIDLLLAQTDQAIKDDFSVWVLCDHIKLTESQQKTAQDNGFIPVKTTQALDEKKTDEKKPKKTIKQILAEREAAQSLRQDQPTSSHLMLTQQQGSLMVAAIASGNLAKLIELDSMVQKLPFTFSEQKNGSMHESRSPDAPYYGALLWALTKGNQDSIDYFLQKVGGLTKTMGLTEQTILQFALAANIQNLTIKTIEALCTSSYVLINQQDTQGLTALHVVARYNSPMLLHLLIKHGVNPAITNTANLSPLDYVLCKKPIEQDKILSVMQCVQLLVNADTRNYSEKTKYSMLMLTNSLSLPLLNGLRTTTPGLLACSLLRPITSNVTGENLGNALQFLIKNIHLNRDQQSAIDYIRKLLELAPIGIWLREMNQDQQTNLKQSLDRMGIDFNNIELQPLVDKEGKIIPLATHWG